MNLYATPIITTSLFVATEPVSPSHVHARPTRLFVNVERNLFNLPVRTRRRKRDGQLPDARSRNSPTNIPFSKFKSTLNVLRFIIIYINISFIHK